MGKCPLPQHKYITSIYPMYGSALPLWVFPPKNIDLFRRVTLIHFNDDRQTPIVFSNTQGIGILILFH